MVQPVCLLTVVGRTLRLQLYGKRNSRLAGIFSQQRDALNLGPKTDVTGLQLHGLPHQRLE